MAWNGDPHLVSSLDQAVSLFEDISTALSGVGCHWKEVALVYLYLADMASYGEINGVYSQYFPVNPPAR